MARRLSSSMLSRCRVIAHPRRSSAPSTSRSVCSATSRSTCVPCFSTISMCLASYSSCASLSTTRRARRSLAFASTLCASGATAKRRPAEVISSSEFAPTELFPLMPRAMFETVAGCALPPARAAKHCGQTLSCTYRLRITAEVAGITNRDVTFDVPFVVVSSQAKSTAVASCTDENGQRGVIIVVIDRRLQRHLQITAWRLHRRRKRRIRLQQVLVRRPRRHAEALLQCLIQPIMAPLRFRTKLLLSCRTARTACRREPTAPPAVTVDAPPPPAPAPAGTFDKAKVVDRRRRFCQNRRSQRRSRRRPRGGPVVAGVQS
jgi:hypothetical protein